MGGGEGKTTLRCLKICQDTLSVAVLNDRQSLFRLGFLLLLPEATLYEICFFFLKKIRYMKLNWIRERGNDVSYNSIILHCFICFCHLSIEFGWGGGGIFFFFFFFFQKKKKKKNFDFFN